MVFSGTDPSTGSLYVYLETLAGGAGATETGDGLDAVQVHVTNTSNLPVEALESEYPLLVAEYALVEGSGGAGRHRGGLGLRRTIEVLGHEARFLGTTERARLAPWGLCGGQPGGRAHLVLDLRADPTSATCRRRSGAIPSSPAIACPSRRPAPAAMARPRSEPSSSGRRTSATASAAAATTPLDIGDPTVAVTEPPRPWSSSASAWSASRHAAGVARPVGLAEVAALDLADGRLGAVARRGSPRGPASCRTRAGRCRAG